ncbi:hypothetical protein BJX68DRAFT_273233 [Aspergillus pseudodeflectus]|uniref:RRM domain-containing protein n=1 Tax=Aspergillus pseudodeflectus TaxID=176178 RepID=A0ABR4JAV6_9EURO
MPIVLAWKRSHLRSLWQGYKDQYGSDLVQDLWRDTADDAVCNPSNPLPRLIVIVITEPYFGIRNLWRSKRSDARRHIVVSCVGESPLCNLVTFYLVRFHWTPQHFVNIKAEFREKYGTSVEETIREKFPPTDKGPNLDDWRDFCIELAMSAENSIYNPPSNTLYVGNLPQDTRQGELHTLFTTQPGYKGLGFRRNGKDSVCYVEFKDARTAGQTLSKLTGYKLSNSGKIGIRLNFCDSIPTAMTKIVYEG